MELKDKIYSGEPIQDRFYNGFSELETVLVRYSNKVGIMPIKDLFSIIKGTERMLSKKEGIWVKDISEEMFVLSREGFDRVNSIVRRMVYEPLVRIQVGSRVTVISSSHKIVVTQDRVEKLVKGAEVKVGDTVFVSKNGAGIEEAKITKVKLEEEIYLYVYGMETTSGGAFISGILQKSY